MKKLALILMCCILFVACESRMNKSASSAIHNIGFEVKEFTLDHKEDRSSIFRSESYTGRGTIAAVGDPELVKKPYLVVVQLTKVKGGRETDTEKVSTRIIEVVNGIGQITTFDNMWGKEKLEQPEYKIDIIGHVQLTSQISNK